MKKQFLILVLVALGMALNSCLQDPQQELMTLQQSEPPFRTRAILDESLTQASIMKKVKDNALKDNIINNDNFDYDNIGYFEMIPTHEKKRNHEYKIYAIPSKKVEKYKSTVCYLLECDGKILWAYIAQIDHLTEKVQQISYFELNGNLIFSADVNSNTHKVLNKFSPVDPNRINLIKTRSENNFPYDNVGACTANCMSDALTDNGWWSVVLGVVIADSGFVGGTSVLAAYCWAACMDWWMFGIH